jgi:hypothetical protein
MMERGKEDLREREEVERGRERERELGGEEKSGGKDISDHRLWRMNLVGGFLFQEGWISALLPALVARKVLDTIPHGTPLLENQDIWRKTASDWTQRNTQKSRDINCNSKHR